MKTSATSGPVNALAETTARPVRVPGQPLDRYAGGGAEIDPVHAEVPKRGHAHQQADHDGDRRHHPGLEHDDRQHRAGADAKRLEHAELADAFEDRHQHRVEDQDPDRGVDDHEHEHHRAARVVEHARDNGHELAPGQHLELGRRRGHAVGRLGQRLALRAAHDQLVTAARNDEQLPEGGQGHVHAAAVDVLRDRAEHPAHDVEVVGHRSVRRLADDDKLVVRPRPKDPAEPGAEHHPLVVAGLEPASLDDALVDLADVTVAIDVHPAQAHPRRVVPRRREPGPERPHRRRIAGVLELVEDRIRVVDAAVKRRALAILERVDVHVTDLQVDDVALHPDDGTPPSGRRTR